MPRNTAPTVRPPTGVSSVEPAALEGEPRHVALEREVRHLGHPIGQRRHPQQLVEERRRTTGHATRQPLAASPLASWAEVERTDGPDEDWSATIGVPIHPRSDTAPPAT